MTVTVKMLTILLSVSDENVKCLQFTLHSSNMMRKSRSIPMQMDRIIAQSGTAAGFCTSMCGNARVTACKIIYITGNQ